MRQDALADRLGLRVLVGTAYELRPCAGGGSRRLQHRREAHGRLSAHCVGNIENLLARAVVGLEHHRRRSGEDHLEFEYVPRFGRTKGVQRLRVVADHRDPRIATTQSHKHIHLQSVDVLVFVDEHVVKRSGKTRTEAVVLHRGAPEQEEVVEIDKPRGTLATNVPAADLGDRVDEIVSPGRDVGYHRREGTTRVHRSRIQVDEQRLARKPSPGRTGMTLLVTHEVDHIRGVGRIEDREALGKAERGREATQGLVRDRVERASDDPSCRLPGCTVQSDGSEQRRSPRDHLPRGAPRECQQEDPLGRRPGRDQPGDPCGQGCGLAGSCSRKDSKRPALMRHDLALAIGQVIKPREHTFAW